MEKYKKLFKGLEMCAGPDCNPECPYHGETRGGKTCRAWLLNDAAVALMGEEGRADELEIECEHLRQRNEQLCENAKTDEFRLNALRKDFEEQDARLEELAKKGEFFQNLAYQYSALQAENKRLRADHKALIEKYAQKEGEAAYWRGMRDAMTTLLAKGAAMEEVNGNV